MRVAVELDGQAALAGLPGRVDDALTDALDAAAVAIAEREASRIRSAGAGSSRQSARAARTVRVVRGDAPGVSAGGVLFWGAEFGARTLAQFRPHRGRVGYWFWPTLRADEPMIERDWLDAGDAIEDVWGGDS